MDVIQQYFKAGSVERQRELDLCLEANIANPYITGIHLLLESGTVTVPYDSRKLKIAAIGGRLTWARCLQYISERIARDRIVIVANADICFDASLALVDGALSGSTVYALLRYDVREDGSLELFGTNPDNPMYHHNVIFGASQDAWIFRNPLPPITESCDFPIGGLPLGDSKINWVFHRAGLVVLNPCLSIRALHIHRTTNSRTYDSTQAPLPPPYLTPRVSSLAFFRGGGTASGGKDSGGMPGVR